jgi:catechol 2,3-dioxygenase-like lactoylglutathione lyase family enzyme
MQLRGIHHVTAIAGPARRNHDFYAGVLWLRLVNLTIREAKCSAAACAPPTAV